MWLHVPKVVKSLVYVYTLRNEVENQLDTASECDF